MSIIHWLSQSWNVGLASLPRWAWALVVAALAAAAALTVHAIITVRARSRDAEQEITQAFATVRSMKIRPPAERAAGDTAVLPAPELPGPAAIEPTGSRAGEPSWEDWTERLDRAASSVARAEDRLVKASDPRKFAAWLEADEAEYRRDVEEIDAILASGAWASTPWLERAA